jgi:hypothetical protein
MKSLPCLLIASSLFFGILSGCSKGDTGPQGPQGAQGNTGAQGNANVTRIIDSTNSSTNWTFITGNGWQAVFVNPSLNNAFIKAGGFAEVFLSTDNGRVWSALPSSYVVDTALSAQMTYSYSTQNTITVNFTWSDQRQHTDPVTTYGSTCLFNVVCIAASVLNQHPGANRNNYEAVTHIQETRQNGN